MRNILCFFILSAILSFSNIQAQELTTFILVRHAEKDMTQSTNDPDLAPEGIERAERLKTMLENSGVTAIYSTPYKRTAQTVKPLAAALGLEVINYNPMDFEAFSKLIKSNPGERILVAGHSNTIPELLNFLLGTNKNKILGEGQYGQVFLVTLKDVGDGVVVELNSD